MTIFNDNHELQNSHIYAVVCWACGVTVTPTQRSTEEASCVWLSQAERATIYMIYNLSFLLYMTLFKYLLCVLMYLHLVTL